MKKLKTILSAILLVITFVFIVVLIFTRVQGKTPQVFGYQILRISSGSMSPELEVGDVILSKRVKDVKTLEVGDVITYRGEFGSYADKNITHKVVVKPYEVNGRLYLQTQGVANSYIDPEVSEEQVIGKMVCVVPFLGSIFSFFMTKWGLIIVLAFLALLFVNEIINLKRAVKESDGSDDESDEFTEKA